MVGLRDDLIRLDRSLSAKRSRSESLPPGRAMDIPAVGTLREWLEWLPYQYQEHSKTNLGNKSLA